MNANKSKRFHHPGEGRRRAVPHPKGRQVDPDAVAEIRALLGDSGLDRDLLIEHLHTIQDRYHGLSPRHLVALADLMRLSLVEVYEVATFYAHFDVAQDDDGDMPEITVRVCDSLPCEMAGANALAGVFAFGQKFRALCRALAQFGAEQGAYLFRIDAA